MAAYTCCKRCRRVTGFLPNAQLNNDPRYNGRWPDDFMCMDCVFDTDVDRYEDLNEEVDEPEEA